MQNMEKRVIVPQNVIMQEVDDEAILLNLKTRRSYVLNPSGMRMLQVLKASPSIEQALTSLLNEYDVDPAVLRADLQELLENLLQRGLVEIV